MAPATMDSEDGLQPEPGPAPADNVKRDQLIEFEPATFVRADDIAAIRPIILAVVDPQNRNQHIRRIQVEVVLRSGVAVRLQQTHNSVEEARDAILKAMLG